MVETIERTQYKVLWTLNFNFSQELADKLYKEFKIDKLKSIIIKANIWFVYDQLKTICQKLLVIFSL